MGLCASRDSQEVIIHNYSPSQVIIVSPSLSIETKENNKYNKTFSPEWYRVCIYDESNCTGELTNSSRRELIGISTMYIKDLQELKMWIMSITQGLKHYQNIEIGTIPKPPSLKLDQLHRVGSLGSINIRDTAEGIRRCKGSGTERSASAELGGSSRSPKIHSPFRSITISPKQSPRPVFIDKTPRAGSSDSNGILTPRSVLTRFANGMTRTPSPKTVVSKSPLRSVNSDTAGRDLKTSVFEPTDTLTYSLYSAYLTNLPKFDSYIPRAQRSLSESTLERKRTVPIRSL